MKIFLTGGSGFVGQNVIPELTKIGHEVFALVRSEASANKVITSGATPVKDQLTALTNTTAMVLKQCDCVVHCAAKMDFTYNKKEFFNINVAATKHLVKMAKKAGVKKFIYISAAPVVSGSPIINLTEEKAEKGLPKALYPRTKAIAEKAVLTANTPNFKTIALRPPAIWGPNNHHYKDLFKAVESGQWRWIGGGTQILSTIHIQNLAQAIIAAINSNKGGEAYFVTDDDNRPLKTTFKGILNAYGYEPGDKILSRSIASFFAHLIGGTWKLLGLKSQPPVAPIMIRLMGTEFSVSDAKARKELGYKSVISFEEGLKTLNKENIKLFS